MRRTAILLFLFPICLVHAQGISFGIFTDVHYATTANSGTMYYQSSLVKLAQALDTFRVHGIHQAFCLGDLDNGYTATDSGKVFTDLDSINLRFAAFPGKICGVIGNHDLQSVTKSQLLGRTGYTVKQNYYSFDTAAYHFVVLDGSYNSDSSDFTPSNATLANASIPAAEKQWLVNDLSVAGNKPVIVLLHYPLDSTLSSGNVLKNNNEIRYIFEAAGNVKAVFSGHVHTGGYRMINGIHYVILQAMVLNALPSNAFTEVTIPASNDSIFVKGYMSQTSQASYRLKLTQNSGTRSVVARQRSTVSRNRTCLVTKRNLVAKPGLSLSGRRMKTGRAGTQIIIEHR